jgi:hypothetical protein
MKPEVTIKDCSIVNGRLVGTITSAHPVLGGPYEPADCHLNVIRTGPILKIETANTTYIVEQKPKP